MLAAIQAFANGIAVTPVDPSLVVSRALSLYAGHDRIGRQPLRCDVIASGMFKEGSGTTAYDTSGVDPAMDLTSQRQYHLGRRLGISFGTGGRARPGTTATSSKLYN